MPRPPRIIVPGLAHHVTQRGNNRQIVFEDEEDYTKYCCWMNDYSIKNRLKILAYCLMSNHVHFVVVPEDEESLMKTFHAVHMRYAHYMHRKKESSGHLWQGRYFSRPMNARHFYRAIRYVEQNPVRGQLVKKPWQYPWSSARWHLGLTKTPDILLSDVDFADKKNWKKYLCEMDEDFEALKNGFPQVPGT